MKSRTRAWLPGFALFISAVMVAALFLGAWQLRRAAEKRHLLLAKETAGSMPVAWLSDLDPESRVDGRLVQLQGVYGPEVILLDNRILKGKAGVEVHQTFLDGISRLEVLINRGWMALPADRSLPEVTAPAGEVRIQARIYSPPGKQLVLRKDTFAGNWPWLVQIVDVGLVTLALDRPLFDQVLRLESGAPGALPRYWPAVNVSPAVHIGYAVQWFGIAGVSLLLGIFYLYRRLFADRGN